MYIWDLLSEFRRNWNSWNFFCETELLSKSNVGFVWWDSSRCVFHLLSFLEGFDLGRLGIVCKYLLEITNTEQWVLSQFFERFETVERSLCPREISLFLSYTNPSWNQTLQWKLEEQISLFRYLPIGLTNLKTLVSLGFKINDLLKKHNLESYLTFWFKVNLIGSLIFEEETHPIVLWYHSWGISYYFCDRPKSRPCYHSKKPWPHRTCLCPYDSPYKSKFNLILSIDGQSHFANPELSLMKRRM